MLLFVTDKCNLNCDYCFNNETGRDLDINMGKMAVDFMIRENAFSKNDSKGICFFGGEPLLKFNLIKDLIEYSKIKRGDLHYAIVTNGTIFNREISEYLSNNNVKIVLSIDGCKKSQDTHRKLSNGKGSHDLISKNMDFFSKYPNIVPRYTFTESNLHFLVENFDYFTQCGFGVFGISGIDKEFWTQDALNLLEKNLNRIADIWCEQIKKRNKFVWIQPLCDYMNRFYDNNYTFHIHIHNCSVGHHAYAVNVDGTIFGCHRFAIQKELPLGHISDDMLMYKGIESLKNVRRDSFGCIALNYQYNKNLNQPPLAHEQLKKIYYKVSKKMYDGVKEQRFSLLHLKQMKMSEVRIDVDLKDVLNFFQREITIERMDRKVLVL